MSKLRAEASVVKKWASSAGQNLALSIVIKSEALALSQQFQLSACAAVTVNKFFKKYAGMDTKIKWPNDLYWKDRKAGGILIESVISQQSAPDSYRDSSQQSAVGSQQSSDWKWAVIGIGININQTSFPAELPNPVSLKQITGKDFDPVESAKEICRIFNDQFEKLITGGFDNIYTEYLSHLYKINEKVKLKQASRVFEAAIKTVSPAGKLIVQHSIEEEFDFGSIEWII